MFDETAYQGYEVIYDDPPWRFKNWSMGQQAQKGERWGRAAGRPVYDCLDNDDLIRLPLHRLAAPDNIRFTWVTFPKLEVALDMIRGPKIVTRSGKVQSFWEFKTCAFVWLKLTPCAYENFKKETEKFFKNDYPALQDREQKSASFDRLLNFLFQKLFHFGQGYWTHGNVELCLLSTAGKPQGRAAANLSQLVFDPIEDSEGFEDRLVITPVSHHSAKPPVVRSQIVKLLGERRRIEVFARPPLPEGWIGTGMDYDGRDVRELLAALPPLPNEWDRAKEEEIHEAAA
jgi:N6-adenosine-specific RNA methylase IME4